MSRFDSYRFGPFVLDARRWSLQRDGEEVPLQPKVFSTLLYFLQRPGLVIPKEQLLADLWPGAFVTDGVLTRCIKELRQSLGDHARDSRFIRTAPRLGYAFVAEVHTGAVTGLHAITSIAVLPFKPLVASQRDEALELGMADSLINHLSKLRRLVVRPLSAVRRYGGLNQNPLTVGREQRVDMVIEGGMQFSADQLRVTVRVLTVADGTSLLAETFSAPFTSLLTVQETIIRSVVEALKLELTQRESEQLTGCETDKLSAYRCYLLGRLNANRHTPDGDRHSIRLFQQAVEQDPGYAQAWGALADSYLQLGTLETNAGHFETARGHAMRGLELQPNLVPALTCLGNIAWLSDWDWPAADRYLRLALDAGAGDASAQVAFSDFCCYQRRFEEAIDAASRAVEIDPNSAWVNALLAQALHMAGLHEEAMAQAGRALEIASDFAFAHLFAGLAAMMSRRYHEGIAHLEAAHRHSSRSDFAGALGWAYGVAGRRDEAQEILRRLAAPDKGTPPIVLSLVHLGLEEDEQTLDLLERAADERDWHVLLLYAEPVFRRLRAQARATHLFSRLQLPS